MKYITILIVMLSYSIAATTNNNTGIKIPSTFYSNDSLRVEAKPAQFIDFGVEGKLYDITEPDMYKIIISAAKEWQKKYDKEKMKKIIEEQVNERATFIDKDIHLCKNTATGDWKNDYFSFRQDFYNPLGRKVFKKGQKILAPSLPNLKQVCFIDAGIFAEGVNQIEYFQKLTNGKCLFLVSNRNVRELREKFPTYEIYPSSKQMEKRFGVKCVPAVVNMLGVKIKNDYYSIEKFKRGIEK